MTPDRFSNGRTAPITGGGRGIGAMSWARASASAECREARAALEYELPGTAEG